MKTTKTCITCALIITFIFVSSFALAQSDTVKANEWVKNLAWAKNLNIKLYPDINSVEFKQQYEASKATWDKVFEFLADSNKLKSLAPGMYPIDGKNAYASITYAPSKTFEASKWESHRKYIDLQYVISGAEKIGKAPLNSVTVTEPYNEQKDAAHYSGDGTYYMATPQVFFLFFPDEAHRPNIKVDGYDMVKKMVIKIKYVQ